MLYRPPNIEDIPEYNDVQKVLREEIVNPLRKNQFVRADKVMKLRKLLDSLTSVTGLMSEEKGTDNSTYSFKWDIFVNFISICNTKHHISCF